MKVFISWSGERSRAVAETLKDWIKCVIQATDPWVSTRDLEQGTQWFAEIADQLKDTAVGIICLTPENKDKPWLHFEAGALYKGVKEARLYTLLVDLTPAQITGPLANFNHTFWNSSKSIENRASLRKLVGDINNALPAGALEEKTLDTTFEAMWGQLEKRLGDAATLKGARTLPSRRTQEDMLEEVLQLCRGMAGFVSAQATKQGLLAPAFSKPMRQPRNATEALEALSADLAVDIVKASLFSGSDRKRIVEQLMNAGYSETEAVKAFREGSDQLGRKFKVVLSMLQRSEQGTDQKANPGNDTV